VALWVTNRPKILRFVDEELLSHWGLEKVNAVHLLFSLLTS
jgi:hypothetical protein